MYKTVKVTLTTHDAGGLSDLDVKMARFMDKTAGAAGRAKPARNADASPHGTHPARYRHSRPAGLSGKRCRADTPTRSPSLAAHDTAIREVILQQIDAFGRGDDAAAFALAAPDIQAQFVGPEVFIAMVKAHYRPVYTAHKLAFPNPARAVQTRPKHAFSMSI